ncbi:hypothetical protein B0H14DRAFT_3767097 [Mycena olivaceomarginata]|nr:hypothetical protein B0H14DRAFT_3767097 [Mycena olivaceomarginata]
MSSIARAILVAVHAASFLALTSISPATTALASPLQASSPVNSSSSLLAARVVSKHTNTELVARIPISSPAALPLQQRVSSANSTYHNSVSPVTKSKAMQSHEELADEDRSPPQYVDGASRLRFDFDVFPSYPWTDLGVPVIVYETKCILDEILDSTENTTDGLLNAVQPL